MTEADGKNIKNNECGGCPVCSLRNVHAAADGLKGIRLVLCAFLVFIAPLIAAVVGASFVQNRYHSSSCLTALAGLVAGGFAVLLAKWLTRRLATTETGCKKQRSS